MVASLFTGFVLDKLWGDPDYLPHPIVGFGKLISLFERKLNRGKWLILKGALSTLLLMILTFILTYFSLIIARELSQVLLYCISSLLIFFCLAGKTLCREVKAVFDTLEVSIVKGRQQLARIVGRDTMCLDAQQIRIAALETLAENLNDGVIAPLFWFTLLGLPGMMTYKMINTLDSMIGYKNTRYLYYGRFAARIDDIMNFIPARITAIIMLMVGNQIQKIGITFSIAKNHRSPNSGYPEAALAAMLDCRFGGPNYYFGTKVEKPYIGTNEKVIQRHNLIFALKINQYTEIVMVVISMLLYFTLHISFN
jgi:adenosylcobinamide-phosphate synthase